MQVIYGTAGLFSRIDASLGLNRATHDSIVEAAEEIGAIDAPDIIPAGSHHSPAGSCVVFESTVYRPDYLY